MSDYIHLTADEFASLAAKANAAQTVGYFIRNLDTLKLELHFEREAYDALSDDAKREIKSLFLWGRRSGCWISRHKEPRLIWAQRLAEKLGLADAGETGVRPSFAEQQQRKAERAEARANVSTLRQIARLIVPTPCKSPSRTCAATLPFSPSPISIRLRPRLHPPARPHVRRL